ncbi:hypothetical protein PR202_ga03089 [Eleusine coracana subsp. coracana]|uniref:Uncharacterized protein n=1 Tax=Eleusine coracana subsp. coracana TaxID=191504 RepID=A0AAV5BP21_ELECO|nr:hypothetical protein PR202_ga03089 [Eleusine coracana subsp. coracana]
MEWLSINRVAIILVQLINPSTTTPSPSVHHSPSPRRNLWCLGHRSSVGALARAVAAGVSGCPAAAIIHTQVLLKGTVAKETMALSRSMRACLHSGRLALLAILVSGGIVLQVLACALYNNWWPMLTVLMYLMLPMPLIFFLGSDTSSMMSTGGDGWVNFTKFLTGASIVGSIAIPSILKHAGVIGWGALTMELSSFVVFGVAILWFLQMNGEDEYSGVF